MNIDNNYYPSLSSFTGGLVLNGGIGLNNTTDAISITNGGTFTSAGGGAIAKDVYIGSDFTATNQSYLIGGGNPNPASTGQLIVPTTTTIVTDDAFVGATLFTGGLKSPSFFDGQITVHDSGLYVFIGGFRWSAENTNERIINMYLDGVRILNNNVYGFNETSNFLNAIFYANENQVLSFDAYQSSSTNRRLSTFGNLSFIKIA
jgi:hypothetical protein